MHILQYQRMGSIYIYESLKAQRSKEGYDYGGPDGLYANMLMHKKLVHYNFEQQAEIIEDAHRHLRASGHIPTQYRDCIFQLDDYPFY
jgi:hypothetical protein